jgi:hypothetical protein
MGSGSDDDRLWRNPVSLQYLLNIAFGALKLLRYIRVTYYTGAVWTSILLAGRASWLGTHGGFRGFGTANPWARQYREYADGACK